ncbi:MAG: hypothetical protein Q4F74_01905 [Synergistaceae bacterium]|nr:hypothetical protein [Synergistaceae bacterium]
MISNNAAIVSEIGWNHVIAVTGALGSGKTEFTMSLADAMAETRDKITLADMDIINPYFCLRTVIQQLERGKVSILDPPGEMKWGDMSYINPEIRTKIYDASIRLILDIGGDAQGALALKQFEPEIREAGYDLIFVVNPYRTHTRTLKELSEMRAKLEDIGGLEVTAVVANPHFMDQTKPEECADGVKKVKSFAEDMGLDMLFGIAERSIFDEVRELLDDDIRLWRMKREILLPWESPGSVLI